ncbi:unnamed protein product [Parnassius apollo]|uniref:(apollo) hypothetical protein n=1 Tax=Parnassius apollo TaxID=110799 RepID=A0A8S3WK19_PARAO|nr:unnamed protein product [Parnassius apollo]
MSEEIRKDNPSILPIALAFRRVVEVDDIHVLQILDDQWRKLLFAKIPEEIKTEKKVDVFWAKLSKWSDLTENKPFSDISQFALDCLVLPHANADCERIFSKINLTKSRTRNRLVTGTVDAILLSCDAIKRNKSGNCTDFEPTEEMLRRANNKSNDGMQCIDQVAEIDINIP